MAKANIIIIKECPNLYSNERTNITDYVGVLELPTRTVHTYPPFLLSIATSN